MITQNIKDLLLQASTELSKVDLKQTNIDKACLLITNAINELKIPEDTSLKDFFNANYAINKTKDSYEIPYISREYYDHTFGLSENIKIGFSVDTYSHEGISEISHTVFKVSAFVDHKLHKEFYLKDGSHILDLGILPEGEHVIAFEALDLYGRRSFRDYFEIRVKEKEAINKYVITNEDLNKYGVIKDGSSDTTESFNNMMNELSKTYNYLVIPQGTYLSTIETSFIPPSNITIDLNGSTLKLQEKQVGSGCKQLKFMQGEDIHVINGKIVGDKDTHDYENSPNNSEWLLGFEITGRCKYSSLENVEISNITGYGGGCGFGADRDNSGYLWAWIGASKGTCEVKPGPIFKYTPGSPVDISKFKVDGCNNFSFGRYLGYQGNPGQWYYRVYFYDENMNKVDDLVGMFYRRVFIPDNVKYAQFDAMGNERCGWWVDDFQLWSFKVPVNFEIKNCKFDDIRCVGFAPSAQESLRMIDCDVARSGYNAARCAFDAEDGWEMMHDFYMSGCNFHDNPNNDWLTCAGLNFLLENNKFDDGNIYIWSRTDGIVVRNNELNGSINVTTPSYNTRNAYRIYNNKITGTITLPDTLGIIKDCEALAISGNNINCKVNSLYTNANQTFDNIEVNFTGVRANDISANLTVKNSVIYSDTKDSFSLSFNAYDKDILFENCIFKNELNLAGSKFNSAKFKNCSFEKALFIKPTVNDTENTKGIIFEDCDINFKTTLIQTNPYAYSKGAIRIEFNNCNLIDIDPDFDRTYITNKELISLFSKTNAGSIVFNNCLISKPNGCIASGYIDNTCILDIQFNNCELDSNLALFAGNVNPENVKININ